LKAYLPAKEKNYVGKKVSLIIAKTKQKIQPKLNKKGNGHKKYFIV